MKTLITTAILLLSVFISGYAQKADQPIEVLMIGTSHGYGKKPVEQFDSIINKAYAFRPDAVFGEWLSGADYDAIPDYWNKANVERRLAYLKSRPYADTKNADKLIRHSYELLREHPNFHQVRMKLARALYLKRDFGNAAYQLYRLDRARPAFGDEEKAAYLTILGVPDSLYRNRTNEYHNILFPLIDKLGQDKILPMDSQRHDVAWSAAWGKTDSLIHTWEKGLDSNSVDGKRYMALTKRTNELEQASNKASSAGNATAYFNSPDGDEYLNIMNFYGARRMFGAAGFPEAAMNEMLRQWQFRNDDMAHNVVNRARAAGAKRVVVGVGANHRKMMVDILRTIPGVTVHEFNSYDGK
ncbi:DUF5694 domain-containing protein [Spirosoma rhododendri]|nr:DUF5694 domain-containing protein [Spirosoma rhododendri]